VDVRAQLPQRRWDAGVADRVAHGAGRAHPAGWQVARQRRLELRHHARSHDGNVIFGVSPKVDGVQRYQGLDVIECPDGAAWEAWLVEHHDRSPGVWLRIAKKGSGVRSVTAGEALDVVLCYGWIDGLRHPQDETYFLQRYTHRRARSAWSRVNVARVEALIAAGRMRPAGLAEVHAARGDGRWAAASGPRTNDPSA
jgi:hypothetical protein